MWGLLKVIKLVTEKCNAPCKSHHTFQQLYPRHGHPTWHVEQMKQAPTNPIRLSYKRVVPIYAIKLIEA
jgi:hypothetical protein